MILRTAHPSRPDWRSHPLLALREPLSRGMAAPYDQMPKFTEPEIDRIIAYINSLAPAD
jgi:cytochrome c1